jgi:3-dehydroquinate dehydratase/shikimate dehydrogenase
MTAICIPIFIKSGVDIEEAVGAAEDALRPGVNQTGNPEGMIELRCDTASVKQMLMAIETARVPVIVTVRPTWEGGFSQKSDEERIALWEAAMEEGAEYVDVELVAWEKSKAIREVMEDVAEKHGTRLIVSNHCFERSPADLEQRLGRLLKVEQAAILKLAWKAESILDGVRALHLMREVREKYRRTLLALAMGEEGQISRLLAKKFEAPFTFATAERGQESAPGQPTVAELRGRYRWAKQRPDIPVFGVIGWPVGHSLSPHIHNAGFDATRADGVYVPLAIQPAYEAFLVVVDGLRASAGMELRGLSVTIPHKDNAIRYVREKDGRVDELSAHIGAINTIVWRGAGGAEPFGLNSDYAGAVDALVSAWSGQREELKGKRVAVLGAGGAARAIVAALAHYDATVVVYNRTLEKAQALAAEFDGKTGKVVAAPWESLCKSCCEAYINCTPLGMHPKVNASPLDGVEGLELSAETVVFDTVYNPLMTKLLKEAKAKGAKIVVGTEMFVRQAAVQFEAFTGKVAPVEVFRKVMERALGK